jgi:hypothetical protein
MVCDSRHQLSRHRVPCDGCKFDESGRRGGTRLFVAAQSLVVQRRTRSDNKGSFAASKLPRGLILNPDSIRTALFHESTTPFGASLRARPYDFDIDRHS